MRPKVLRNRQPSSVESGSHRYWSPQSQPYASGDQLLRYLQEGWGLESQVEVETRWFGEARHNVIYHLVLNKHDRRLLIAVLGGPFIQELLDENALVLNIVAVRPTRKHTRPMSVGDRSETGSARSN